MVMVDIRILDSERGCAKLRLFIPPPAAGIIMSKEEDFSLSGLMRRAVWLL